MFLYGSVARGDFNLSSDIDLLVVSNHLPHEPLARSASLHEFVEGREEPKGLLEVEFDRLQADGQLWYLDGALEI